MLTTRLSTGVVATLVALFSLGAGGTAGAIDKVRMDYATYNPVSLLLKEQGLLEKELAADKIAIEWTFSAGSNKALEGLEKNLIDFGSSAGAAAFMSRAGGLAIKSIYVFSRPEWT